MGAHKYILIPDYKPLFAMRECFGPTNGPLEKPNYTPVEIIHKLLLQSGADSLHIFEVKKKEDGTFTKPVALNLSNYAKDYDEIADGKPHKKIEVERIPEKTSTPVTPTIVHTEKEEKPLQEDTNTVNTVIVDDNKEEKESESSSASSTTTNMTRAERRAAARLDYQNNQSK